MHSRSLLVSLVVLSMLAQSAVAPLSVDASADASADVTADVLEHQPVWAATSTAVATPPVASTVGTTTQAQTDPDDQPIERWNRTYGGAHDDHGTVALATEDGFLVAGATRSFGQATVSRADLWLLDLADDGTQRSARAYGTGSDERPVVLFTPSDGGALLVGEIGIAEGVLVYRLDAEGDVQWRRVYGAGTAIYAGTEAPDGDGYLLAGGRITGNGTQPGALFTVDGEGQVTSTRTFVGRGAAEERLTTLHWTHEGDLVLLGESDRTEDDVNTWGVRLAPNGSVDWNRVYGSASLKVSTAAVTELPDGDLLVVGTQERNDIASGWLARLNGTTGQMEWRETYDEHTFADVVADDEGALVVGTYRRDRAPTSDAVLLAVDGQGRQRWEQRYGDGGDEAFSAIVPTDTGYLLVGATSSRGAGRDDVYAVRVDRPVHVREFAVSSRAVETGENVTVTATAVNRLAAPRNHTARLLVDGEVRETQTVALGPGEATTVAFTTSFATAGDYAVGVDTVRPVDVTVTEPTPEPTAAPTATPEPTPTPTPEPTPAPTTTTETTSPGFGLLAALAALVALAVMALRTIKKR